MTRHGPPGACLLDVETDLRMRQHMAVLEDVARGEEAIAEGRVATHAQAGKRLARGRRRRATPGLYAPGMLPRNKHLRQQTAGRAAFAPCGGL